VTEEAAHGACRPAAAARQGALDNLDAYIPGDRRRALALGTPMPDRVRGAALFADISGFTPLTEALARELGPQRGAEALTEHLNRVFHALIEDLDRFGGHVIYFSGDAITCWIDGDDGLRATACGLAMQETMAHLREVVTPAGARVPLALKVAVAVGSARRFVAGDPDIQLLDVLAGRLIDALAVAERHAGQGEVVLERSALDSLGDRVEVREQRIDAESGQMCGIVARTRCDVPNTPSPILADSLPTAVARPWLLAALYERLRAGRAEFLAELRPAFPLFVRFGGFDFDADDEAVRKFDDFIRRVQRIVTAYGGNVLHLTLGDKGAYLYAVFGSPLAHEDDATRAASAALELRELPSSTAATHVQIGIAYGRLHSGTYGHERRLAFTCLGDAVNVAARLMVQAPPGQIYVVESVRGAAGDAFAWEKLEPVTVKGKAEAISVFALMGSKGGARREVGGAGGIVGRAAELAALTARLDGILNGQGGVVGLSGEAGIGKSRLVAEFVGIGRRRGILVAAGECQSYGSKASYLAWREVWSTLFRLDRKASEDDQVRTVEAELAAVDPSLVARAPLLAVLLDLPLPDNDLTGQFDAKLRKTSLEGLLVECLRAQAKRGPILIVLEDCHWLDPLSRDLLEVLARTLPALPVLILLAYRPASDVGESPGLQRLAHFQELTLTELDRDSAVQLIRSKLEQTGSGDPPSTLIEIIVARAQGNPLYIEELLNFIASQGVDPHDVRALKALELPESLHSLILSRIDTLEEGPRQVLKVASVLGRVFPMAMLPGVYPELGGLDAIAKHLARLDTLDLVHPDQEATYIFKHVVTREVAYESMPFAFRSMLHERAGDYVEETEADGIERHLDLLAHHYWHSESVDKKREYLGRAGAAAQASYANAAAIDYFERLAPLLSKGSRLDVLLKLGKVLEVTGDWHRAEEVDGEALALAEGLDDGLRRASCQSAIAEVARKRGRYAEALDLLNKAARGFAAFGEESGVARVLHLVGTVLAQRGDYDKAEQSYRKSLQIRERTGDKAGMASLLSNLAIITEYRGDYEGAQQFHERALALRESVGDLWAISVSMSNLGQIAVFRERYDEGREWLEKSMLLARQVGDTWMIANCHNNLGNAMRGFGDYAAARAHYADSLRAYRDYDDRWSLTFLLEDIGVLAGRSRDAPSALELIGAADALREAIGAPRAPSTEREIQTQLAAAVAELSGENQVACRERGRALELAAAVERALEVCRET
jgi:class 3 adenylate cyclase/tetratricopeptide (TPR) repeat protein